MSAAPTYLQNPLGVQVPVVGGSGQSAAVEHSLVQMYSCWSISHWS
jgi:hypothetical protein